MSRKTRDRQVKQPREKQTSGQRCGRKKPLTEQAARAVVQSWISQGAAPSTVAAYRCGDHYHCGHTRGATWSR